MLAVPTTGRGRHAEENEKLSDYRALTKIDVAAGIAEHPNPARWTGPATGENCRDAAPAWGWAVDFRHWPIEVAQQDFQARSRPCGRK